MIRKIPLIILACVCIGACGSKRVDFKASEKITVGVLYFERHSTLEELEPYRAGLTDMFISKLQELPQLQVVERTRLDQIMNELGLTETGVIDPKTAQKIGRLMGAQALFYGSFTAIGKIIELNGRFVRVETGAVEAGGSHRCKIDDEEIFKMVDKVSKIVTRKIKAKHKELVADSFYSKGRTAEENDDIDNAVSHYKQALQYQANHELSQKSLERLQP